MTTHVTQHTQSGQEKIQWRLSLFLIFFSQLSSWRAAAVGHCGRLLCGLLRALCIIEERAELEIILENCLAWLCSVPLSSARSIAFHFYPSIIQKDTREFPFMSPARATLPATCLRLWVPLGIHVPPFTNHYSPPPSAPLYFSYFTCFGVDFA